MNSRQTRSRLVPFVRIAMILATGVLASAEVARAQFSFELLHSFTAPTDGVNPSASLIQAADGYLYGTTRFGGGSGCSGLGCGTVFRMAADGTGYTVLHAFTGDLTDGANPQAALIQAADGNLYGTTSRTVFRITPDGANYGVLHVFSDPFDGVLPQAALMQAADGDLYGTTYYGGFSCFETSCGTVFKMALDGTGYTVLHRFTGGGFTPAANPTALLQGADGTLYGATRNSTEGTGCGSIFQISPDGTGFAIVHQFANPDGCAPLGDLIQAADGNLYGTTYYGGDSAGCGSAGCGTIFGLARDGTGYSVLHVFTGGEEDGAHSQAGLIQAADGTFYGTTTVGGGTTCFGGNRGCGTLFRIASDGTGYGLLHAFTGAPMDGANPQAALLRTADGNLYATTYAGGSGCFGAGCGTVFQTAPDGTGYTILLRFNGHVTDGASPEAPLIQAADGDLYGTTSWTSGGGGIVFHMAPDGTAYTILHAFKGGVEDGADPQAALIQAADGNLYGTTYYGGGSGCSGVGCGTVFRIATDGTGYTILHRFSGTDGAHPQAALIQAADGNLYGTTYSGGDSSGCFDRLAGCGTIFRIGPDGTGYTILHVFAGGTDGGNPDAALIQAADGNLYGTTSAEGGGGCSSVGCGTVFQIFTDGSSYTILHAFTGGPTDGSNPNAALIQAADGNLYGTTRNGGSGCSSSGCGTVFRIEPGGTGETILHDFAGGPTDGGGPLAALIQAADGNLYGTTSSGGGSSGCGSAGCGTIFQLAADGTGYTILYAFTGGPDGASPTGALIQATDGNFYGTASSGLVGAGTIYRILPDGTGPARDQTVSRNR